MGQIIKFPVQHSNAYTNLEQLFAICDNKESLEAYFEIMAVCHEADYFLPGEFEQIQEIARNRRLELSKPKEKIIEVVGPGLYLYWPEMGEKKPDCDIEASRSYYGNHFFITTSHDLKGRGIKFDRILEAKNLSAANQYKAGWKEYVVTERAFEMLQKKYSISQEVLLD